ncbi:hypothetical protein CUMW_070690 [Citrus unshiu]|nr:hypothetical protein CUMW_070690 [Citrus unshiu]
MVALIRFILLQNRQGKTRLAKYYVPLEDSEKHKVEYEVHRLVVNRDPKFTNFVEKCRNNNLPLSNYPEADESEAYEVLELTPSFRTHKVIYRRYAGLFFSLCVDITDNELAYLECIHLFVEILDHFFSNVCELDLVFNFHKYQYKLRNTRKRRATKEAIATSPCIVSGNLMFLTICTRAYVYLILDEFILAGELQETSKRAIIERMGELEKLE